MKILVVIINMFIYIFIFISCMCLALFLIELLKVNSPVPVWKQIPILLGAIFTACAISNKIWFEMN